MGSLGEMMSLIGELWRVESLSRGPSESGEPWRVGSSVKGQPRRAESLVGVPWRAGALGEEPSTGLSCHGLPLLPLASLPLLRAVVSPARAQPSLQQLHPHWAVSRGAETLAAPQVPHAAQFLDSNQEKLMTRKKALIKGKCRSWSRSTAGKPQALHAADLGALHPGTPEDPPSTARSDS